jgi:7 transmembrane receptor (Secretin family)
MSKTARLANYCWMLNEGVYLHKMIVNAFQEQSNMRYFHLFGWGAPILVIIPYSIVHSMEIYDHSCWTESMDYLEFIYNVLPLSCVAVSENFHLHRIDLINYQTFR